MIGSLGELVSMPGMPSEPTLKKLIAEHPDFPVLKRGKNGVAYEFDLEEAWSFVRDLNAREEEQARERAAKVRQLGLGLLGGESLSAPSDVGLSPAERKALLEEELVAIKVAAQRGRLIDKAGVEQALSALIVRIDQQRRSFTARVTKRVELTRAQIAGIEAVMTADQMALANDLERLADHADMALVEDGGDDAATDCADPAHGDGICTDRETCAVAAPEGAADGQSMG